MTKRFRSAALLLSILLPVVPAWERPAAAAAAAAAAVPGSIDFSFDPTANGSRIGLSGGSPTVETVLQQPDGKVLVGGWFIGANGTLRNNIARLNADGSVDETFQPGYGPDGGVLKVALQPDGKVVIIGSFQTVGGQSHPLIARLHSDGRVDDSFSCRVEGDANLRLTGVAVQQTGKIWIGGQFTSVNGVERLNLARLNADGSVDVTVDPTVEVPGTSAWVYRLILQPDDKLLVAGAWGGPQRNVLRLMADGSLDTGFATVVVDYPIIGAGIRDITVNANGSIAIVGHFSSVNGVARRHVARLNSNGTVDTLFNPGEGPDYNFLWTVSIQPDNKLIIGGNFGYFSGSARVGLARLNANGTVDSGFDPGDAAGVPAGYYAHIVGLAPHNDGGVLVAASAWWTRETTNSVFRLDNSGRRVPSFAPLMQASVEGAGRMVLQSDGKVVFGLFGSYTRSGLARVHANGLYDESFAPDVDFGYIHDVTLQPDNRILVATTPPLDPQRGMIVRLHPDGTVDDEFQAPFVDGGEAPIETLALQPDGKILAAGLIWSVDDHPHRGIVRLHSDGSFDSSFQPVPVGVTDDPGYGIEHVIVLPDGKIFIAGGFTWDTGEAAGIALLEPDGTVDQNFAANVTPVNYVPSALRQPDGKFLLSVSGRLPGLIRINPDGTDDPTFHSVIEDGPYGMALQADGRILVTAGTPQTGNISRLNPDGSLDATFQADLYPGGAELLIQPDGQVLVSGGFHSVNGIPIHSIVRLNNDVRWRLELASLGPGPTTIMISGQPGVPLVIEASPDLSTWSTVGEVVSATTPVSCIDPDAANFTQRFYRARQKQ